jgi:hypothetical protein
MDLTGQCSPWNCLKKAYRQTIRAVAVVPYAVYYGGYKMNKWAAKHPWASPLRPLGVGMQAVGILDDAQLDLVKGVTGFHESVWDEHHRGSVNPFHAASDTQGPFLPGLYWRHGPRVDWAW